MIPIPEKSVMWIKIEHLIHIYIYGECIISYIVIFISIVFVSFIAIFRYVLWCHIYQFWSLCEEIKFQRLYVNCSIVITVRETFERYDTFICKERMKRLTIVTVKILRRFFSVFINHLNNQLINQLIKFIRL